MLSRSKSNPSYGDRLKTATDENLLLFTCREMISTLRKMQTTLLSSADRNAYDSADQLIGLLEKRNKLAEEMRVLEIRDIRHHHTLEAKAKYLIQTRVNQSSRRINVPLNLTISMASGRRHIAPKDSLEVEEQPHLVRNNTSIVVFENSDDSKLAKQEVAALRDLEETVRRETTRKDLGPMRDAEEDGYLGLQGKDMLTSLKIKTRGKIARGPASIRRLGGPK